jgi:hypothetical protein
MKLNSSYPNGESTSESIHGNEKVIFGQDWLKSVKSIHMRYFSLDFFTMTMFDSHSGYCTLRMNPAYVYLFRDNHVALKE